VPLTLKAKMFQESLVYNSLFVLQKREKFADGVPFLLLPNNQPSCALIFLLIPARFSPLPISAITGTGTGDLLDLVCAELRKFEVLKLLYLP